MRVDPKLKKLYDDLVAVIAEASREEALDFDRRSSAFPNGKMRLDESVAVQYFPDREKS